MIRLPKEREGDFWSKQRERAMRASTDPEWVERQFERPADPVKRSRVLMRTVVGALVIIGCIAIVRGVWGAEPKPWVWVLWDEVADKPYVSPKTGAVHEFSGPTACNTDEPIKSLPERVRLSCRRIPKTN